MTDEAGGAWPAGANLSAHESVAAVCGACALPWRVHRSMAGFRVRCRCGAWVPVPAAPDMRALPGSVQELAESRAAALAAPDDDEAAILAAAPRPAALAGVRGWDGRPLRPDADGGWSLRHAEVEVRSRWTNRTVLTLVAIMACFWGPPMVVYWATEGAERAVYMPITSVASALLVLLVAHEGREYAVQGLRNAKAAHWLEAFLVASGLCLCALAFSYAVRKAFPSFHDETPELRRELGLPMLLFVMSFCPGVFEELAFRGVLQGRLNVLMGRVQAFLVCGAVFGVAHGLQLGLPFQIGFGIYAAWLRDRSGSLLPGMMAHALYNAGLVVVLSSTA